ncbi:MAG: hypothetical protein GXP49_11680 [Deltaproteobacteria bacterium]|nr:hypothetical protein [Deltaproteobacteria bacterium]
MISRRHTKLVNISQAISLVKNGSKLALGGLELLNRPMYLVREVIRRGINRLVVMTTPCGSIDVDMLVGVGLVRELIAPRVSLGPFGTAPSVTKAISERTIKHSLIDGASLVAGYRAAACSLSAAAVPGSFVSAVRKESPLLREYLGPSGRPELAVRALTPDVAFIHAQESDEFGNGKQLGGTLYDLMIAKASKRVVLQVDRIVSPEEIRGEPAGVSIPGVLVDYVVQGQMAAHPTASAFNYLQDEKEVWDYAAAAATKEGFDGYVRDRVRGAATQREYLAKIPAQRLAGLEEWWEKSSEAGSEGILGQEDYFRR